jgi:hypothetical protein
MRDPMRFVLFRTGNPQVVGYYQRMVLDRRHRVELRAVGMVFSFFGLMIFTAVLDGLLKVRFLHVLSDACLGLLSLSFLSVFIFGLIDAIVQGVRGRGGELMFGWYQTWKQSMELGPVAAFPIFEPRMDREKKVFTAVYSILVASTLLLALLFAHP